jgi:aminopeptidase N
MNATIGGFVQPDQVDLLRPYRTAYFEVLPRVWRDRTMEMAQDITMSLYPAYLVDEETLSQTDAFLAAPDLASPLRRLLGEGRDGVVRAMRARAKDA